MTNPSDEFSRLTPSVLPPWEPIARRKPSLARILREVIRLREPLADHYPNILIPAIPEPTRLGAIMLVWSWWEDARSPCAACGAIALMVSWGGMLSIGHMTGVCLGCQHVVTRYIGGMAIGLAAVHRALDGSGYKMPMQFGPGWSLGGRAVALVAVLQELGATGLPNCRRARL